MTSPSFPAVATTTPGTNTTHVLAFPFPAQGHMLPFLDFIHQLALQGLKITILVTPKNLPIINPLRSTHPNSIHTLVLPFPPHPKLPLGIENVKDIGNFGIPPIIASLSKLEGEVVQWFQSHPSPPRAIMYDFFFGYTQHWGKNLNVPTIAFCTSGAFSTCFFQRLMTNMAEFRTLDVVQMQDIPRCPSFNKEQHPSLFENYREDDSDWKIVKECILTNPKSWCYVFNSFYALEGEYIDQVKNDLGHDRVFSVGPLTSLDGNKRVNPDSDAGCGVLKWLDTCPDESVLYVCFGSQKLLTKPQIEALALGLERSKTRFVWVINKAKGSQWVPQGFEERVWDQGLVVKGWAPQVEILNHNAVGGFVSHCGWNSLLESVLAGVMVLAWPMEADQFQNAKQFVEYAGLAIHLCEGEHTVPELDELARIISESINENIPQKENVKVMRQKALEAVNVGGRSSTDLYELVKELSQNIASNT